MLFSLLTGSSDAGKSNNNYLLIILIVLIIVAFAAWMIFSGRKGKARQKEYLEQLEAIRPGHKVKTVGGICGIVVEVCDDNTVVIETGSEQSGKSYVKMDKELIAQTDAKGPTQIAREEAEARRKAEKEAKKAGIPLEEKAEESTEEIADGAEEVSEAQPEEKKDEE
ncbi:MAG: preprotein translocase subunit YajC [Clostridia bacterium]|nr:preprotein translocase subunit YajC [Clostridia bacterium]